MSAQTATTDQWIEPNVTRGEAIAAGLHCAEYSVGADFFRAYGRSEQEAIRNVLAKRDREAVCFVTTDADPAVWSGANWRDVTPTELGELR